MMRLKLLIIIALLIAAVLVGGVLFFGSYSPEKPTQAIEKKIAIPPAPTPAP